MLSLRGCRIRFSMAGALVVLAALGMTGCRHAERRTSTPTRPAPGQYFPDHTFGEPRTPTPAYPEPTLEEYPPSHPPQGSDVVPPQPMLEPTPAEDDAEARFPQPGKSVRSNAPQIDRRPRALHAPKPAQPVSQPPQKAKRGIPFGPEDRVASNGFNLDVQPVKLSPRIEVDDAQVQGFADAVSQEPLLTPPASHLESLDRDALQTVDGQALPVAGFSVPNLALCQEVRGYADVTRLDSNALTSGQPVVIYAEIAGFESRQVEGTFRTCTLSSVEIVATDGNVVTSETLGKAVDQSAQRRADYFLAHQFEIPQSLVAGDYTLRLTVIDLQGTGISRRDLPLHITEDRILPDEMDGIAGFDTGPSTPLAGPHILPPLQ